MKKPAQHPIVEVPRRQAKVEMTVGIDLGDVWSHYWTLNRDGEVVDRGTLPNYPEGDREVVHRCSSSASCDGGWNTLDLEHTRSGSANSCKNQAMK